MQHTTVLVLGAGFSGLAAATRLRALGIDVGVVEARDRVGGRTHTRYVAGGLQIDLGGQWFGPGQDRMYELAAEHGVETFPLQEHGEARVHLRGAVVDAPDETVHQLHRAIDEVAATVDLEDPAATPQAADLDATTMRTWMLERTDEETARYVGRVIAGGVLGVDAGDISMLQVAFYVRSGMGVQSLLATEGGAQQDRVVGGPFALAERMAATLGDDAVEHGFVVTRLERRDDVWHVTARDGRTRTADRVVTAIPTPLLAAVQISPDLPGHRRRAITSLQTGNALKFHAVYPSPTWRERGLSGVFNSSVGRITEAVDNSVPGRPEGVLSFFVCGDDAHAVSRMSADERRAVLTAELADRLEDPALAAPQEFVDFSWDDEPFTRGCYSSSFGVGAMHRHAVALRTPWQGLHFAGTETATHWNGYFEGAVRSGEREADLVAASLQS